MRRILILYLAPAGQMNLFALFNLLRKYQAILLILLMSTAMRARLLLRILLMHPIKKFFLSLCLSCTAATITAPIVSCHMSVDVKGAVFRKTSSTKLKRQSRRALLKLPYLDRMSIHTARITNLLILPNC